MKKLMMVIVVTFFSMMCLIAGAAIEAQPVAEDTVAPVAVDADEAAKTAEGEVITEEDGEEDGETSAGAKLMVFLNTPLGISVVGAILAFLLGKVFTAKPKWKALVLKYGPSLMQAIKSAEKNIADDTGNAGLAKLDAALKYLIELEPKLKKVSDVDLKTAISAVHAKAESSGNLSKG